MLVFGVILFLFKDFKIAITILIIAVLGIAGSYLALYLTNTPLNVGSYTGLIMIVGIIGENSIFTFLQFKESLHTSSVDESIIYSISTRLRPKLMTALVLSLLYCHWRWESVPAHNYISHLLLQLLAVLLLLCPCY